MSKLLSDEGLRKQIETILLEWSSEMTGEPRHKLHPEVDQLVMRHIDLINEQKRLYAESEVLKARIDEQNEVIDCLFKQVGENNVMEYKLMKVKDRSENRIKELRLKLTRES